MSIILVTGGLGRVGRAVVADLVAAGRNVRILDRAADDVGQGVIAAAGWTGVGYVAGDINDYSDLLAKAPGCATVVHLAALPQPRLGTPDEVFRINVAGTFNVFRAAEHLGIRRVVQASSINAIGLYFGLRPAEPQYFPIDDDHPPQCTDAYSLSKQLAEEIGGYHWRRSGISSIALRLPYVQAPVAEPVVGPRPGQTAGVLAMTADDQRRWLDDFQHQVAALRPLGLMESQPPPPDTDALRGMVSARNCCWTGIDERDVAQAVRRGLDAAYDGAHPLFVTAAANTAGVDSERLLSVFFPAVTARTRALIGDESLVSWQRAHDLIGFTPRHRI